MARDVQANPAAAIQSDSALAPAPIRNGLLRPRTRTARAHLASEYAYPSVGLHANTKRRACVEPRPQSNPTALDGSIADGRLAATVLQDVLSTLPFASPSQRLGQTRSDDRAYSPIGPRPVLPENQRFQFLACHHSDDRQPREWLLPICRSVALARLHISSKQARSRGTRLALPTDHKAALARWSSGKQAVRSEMSPNHDARQPVDTRWPHFD